MKKISAFTLADTLITLAIIGVVAALTIPTLMKNYQRAELESRFKNAYQLFSGAVQKMYADNGADLSGLPPMTGSDGNAVAISFGNYFADNYLGGKVSSMVVTYSGRFRNNNYYQYNGKPNDIGGCAQGEMSLKNGMYLVYRAGCFNSGMLLSPVIPNLYTRSIIVDVNGLDKKPNRWGYDIWSFNIDPENGRLVPDGLLGAYYGHDVPFKCGSKGRAKFNEDYGCSYYAIINKCPEDNTKSYWECLKF